MGNKYPATDRINPFFLHRTLIFLILIRREIIPFNTRQITPKQTQYTSIFPFSNRLTYYWHTPSFTAINIQPKRFLMNIIPFHSDNEILNFIDQLPDERLYDIGAYRPKALKHYLEKQMPWIETEIYYLGIRLHRQPEMEEIAQTILETPHSKRFRAYYALRYPELIEPISA
jgi:hypothetical protein